MDLEYGFLVVRRLPLLDSLSMHIVMCGRTYARRRPDQQHLPDQQLLPDRQRLPDRQHLMGRTYSRRRRARDVRRAAERAEHVCEEDSATRG
jgi:hypothetical protein